MVQGFVARSRVMFLRIQADAYRAKFQHTGSQSDLDAAIESGWAAVAAVPLDHSERGAYLSNLGNSLLKRYEREGDQADLDAAVDNLHAAVDATPAEHPGRAACLTLFGTALRLQFDRTGDQSDLDAALEFAEAAVAATGIDHPHRAACLTNLGNALQQRCGRTRNQADLDAAVENHRTAVAAAPAGHPDRAAYLANLGQALRLRFALTEDHSDLDAAVEFARAAVDATPAGHPDRAACLTSLGSALQVRYERTGDQADLDDAVDNLRAAVDATPAGHPDRAACLSNLGRAQRARYERTGAQTDLDSAIESGRAAIDATPADDPGRAAFLTILGSALPMRFERTRDQADLDDAIDLVQAAVDATPAGHPDRAGYLSNLGNAQQARFARTGNQADLDAAIDNLRAAVDATPAGHPDHAGRLSNLGNALRLRFERTGESADAEAAVDNFRAAIAATPADHPNQATYLLSLGTALGARFARTGMQSDPDSAIDTLRAAVAAVPVGHSDQEGWCLLSLGNALHSRFEKKGTRADWSEMLSAFTKTVDRSSAAPSVRIWAARAAASLIAESDPGRAADLLEVGVRLLPEVAPRQLQRGDQQYNLGGFAGLAADAAALVLADIGTSDSADDRAKRALALLETGRAILVSQTLDTRGDLTDLRDRNPALAARFVELREHLDRVPNGSASGTTLPDQAGNSGHNDDPNNDRYQLVSQLAATLTRIRALDGFATFGPPPAIEELTAQAASGPVVTFNISAYRSDALLLTQNGITSLELPGLALHSLLGQINSFQEALHTTTNPETGSRARREAQATLSGVLEWLWDTTAEPVLNTLGYQAAPTPGTTWPRVWWAPGGLLSLLPIHAAGYHTGPPPGDHGRRTVMDRVVSSYTPTIRALRHARQHAIRPQAPSRALIVAMPTTPSVPGWLEHVRAEAIMLHGRLPSPVLLAEPGALGADPSFAPKDRPAKANVLTYLPSCRIAHFACHGASDPADPSKSLLLLHDHSTDPLTVASLAPVNLDHAELAYLSACRTAFTSTAGLLDESIHLTSAFQLAGFPHVVGTLWEIDDAVAVTLADTFYAGLGYLEGTLDTSCAARALHHAVQTVRDDLPATPSRWAAYIHAGA
jgi:hypothetical protein